MSEQALHGEFKLPGGKLIVVDFQDRDGRITGFSLSGDFFLEPDDTLFIINDALEGMPVGETIAAYERNLLAAIPEGSTLIGVTPAAIAIAVRRACTDAAKWRDLDWQVILTPPIAPALNTALDEVLLREVGQGGRKPTMRIWEWDADAVIIGSFQSVRNEVDEEQAAELGATVIRRISGGGAMYMQPNSSISYSIYVPTSFVDGMSFEESYAFLDEWVLEALSMIGVEAMYKPLNDITSPLGKIGGAAQKRLAAGAVLHHATMSYDMDGERMARVLRIGREKLSDKGTKSAAKRVDPLRSQTGLSRAEIIDTFVSVFMQRHGAVLGEITPAEFEAAEALATSKFLDVEWLRRIP